MEQCYPKALVLHRVNLIPRDIYQCLETFVVGEEKCATGI